MESLRCRRYEENFHHDNRKLAIDVIYVIIMLCIYISVLQIKEIKEEILHFLVKLP